MNLILAGFGIFVLSFFVFTSCKDNNPAEQYGTTMTQAYKSAKKLDAKLNVQQVQKSIQEFYAANGRYPADLNELSSFCGLALKSDNYDYNSTDGTLTERK